MAKSKTNKLFIFLIPLVVITMASLFITAIIVHDYLSYQPETPMSQPTPIAIEHTATPVLPAQSLSQIPAVLTPDTVSMSTDTVKPVTYTVEKGDTIYKIAIDFGSTIEAIKAINNLDGDLIQPGQVLLIPGVLPTEATVEPLALPSTETSVHTENSVISGTSGYSSVHIVFAGDTMESIAGLYEISVEDLRTANFMVGDAILDGQRLVVPSAGPITPPPWRFSVLERDFFSAYPLALERDRFSLHYSPDTYPSVDPPSIATLVETGLATIESVMQSVLQVHFDVFAAGSIFAPPNRALRGRSFSYARQSFILHDGTGNAADQQYIIAHELTHLFTWNVFGQPVSPMLSEGAAVYTGMKSIAGTNHMPLDRFCRAYLDVGQLPRVSTSLSFQGHIYDLENYYAAGCFVGYLIEAYGPQAFGQLYPNGNFENIYGKTIASLEEEWRAQLGSRPNSEDVDAIRFVAAVETLEAAYQSFFPNFIGSPEQITAYRELDKARVALLEGRLDDMDDYLTAFYDVLHGN